MDEVSNELRVSLATVKRLLKTGELGSMKIAGQRRISRFDLNRYFRAMRRAERAEPREQASLQPSEPPSALDQGAREIATAAAALFLMCEGGKLVVSNPSGRYAEVPIVATAQGMDLMPADVARIFQIALEQLGHVAPAPAKNGAAHAAAHDPRQPELPYEPDVELEEDPPLLESDAEELLAEEEDDRSADERAEDREGDPQFDPFPERL